MSLNLLIQIELAMNLLSESERTKNKKLIQKGKVLLKQIQKVRALAQNSTRAHQIKNSIKESLV